MPRKYTGNSDGNAGKALPGTLKLVELCQKRWGFTNLGVYANRRMNNSQAAKDPKNPKWLSVHATGRACDIGYVNRKVAEQAWDWFIANTAALGIEEIHDYAFDSDGTGPKKPWGRGYRCSRGEGKKGVKIFTETDNAGTPGGKWLHIELSPEMAADAAKFEAAWRSIKPPAEIIKPGKVAAAASKAKPKPKPAKGV
jgi:hypothetical protein